MFKLQPNPTFKMPIGISVAGQAAPTEIEVEFKYLTKSKVREFFDKLGGKEDAAALAEIIVGWSGIDEPFTKKALAALVDNYPAAAMDLFDGFRRELLEAKRKN